MLQCLGTFMTLAVLHKTSLMFKLTSCTYKSTTQLTNTSCLLHNTIKMYLIFSYLIILNFCDCFQTSVRHLANKNWHQHNFVFVSYRRKYLFSLIAVRICSAKSSIQLRFDFDADREEDDVKNKHTNTASNQLKSRRICQAKVLVRQRYWLTLIKHHIRS